MKILKFLNIINEIISEKLLKSKKKNCLFLKESFL